jgi:hypothetical protein
MNPLLLALAKKHTDVAVLLFEQVKGFHRLNCLSKPYPLERQKLLVFDHTKRIKRECFALKLAILNKDEDAFTFLWHDLRTYWNLAHFFVCLKAINRAGWEEGLRLLLESTTSQVIFLSVNSSCDDFVDVIDMLLEELQ